MTTIAFYNLKGGVGKTAAAVNIAYMAARDGLSTLLWDLDPQGAATWCLGEEPVSLGKQRKLLKGRTDMGGQVLDTAYERLSLLPADFDNRTLDLALDDLKDSTKRFRHLVEPLAGNHRLLVLDCPPSISLVSENVFHVADHVVVPVIPTPLSMQSLDLLRRHYQDCGLDVDRLIPVFSMVDYRKALHREIMATSRKACGACRIAIPYRSAVEQMAARRAPLPAFDPRGPATLAYEALWVELRKRTGLRRKDLARMEA